MKRFKQSTVVIIGAESTIGQAAAIRFACEGANVVLIGHLSNELARTAKQLPHDNTWIQSDNYLTITCDIKDPNQVQTMIQEIKQHFGKIDILVNKVGFAIEDSAEIRSTPQTTESDWHHAIQTDRQSFESLCQKLLPELTKSRGSIINVLTSFNNQSAAYQDAKISIQTLTQRLALSFAKNGVRVNLVHSNALVSNADHQPPLATISPLDCPATPKAIAAATAFLASQDAAAITGVSLPVDGGFDISDDDF